MRQGWSLRVGQGTKALRAWNILGAVAGRSLPRALCGVRSGVWPSGELATAVVKTEAHLPRLGAQSLALSGSFHLPSVQWCSVDVGQWRPGLDREAGGFLEEVLHMSLMYSQEVRSFWWGPGSGCR